MERLRERADQLKEKRPGYAQILDFYVQVREAQDASRASVKVEPLSAVSEAEQPAGTEVFPVDREAARQLFENLCRIGKTANPHLAEQLEKIDRALVEGKLSFDELVEDGCGTEEIERAAAELELDAQVLSFLVQSSIRPSIEAGMERLRDQVDTETWRKSQCPVCGSLPALSLLEGEGGKRYSLCSCCGCKWRIDRLSCSICGNKEHGTLHYFTGEGEEAHRIDLCDSCHHYIKTIDYQNLEKSDPSLEDLGTLHLDVLATQKGYKKPGANPWLV